MLESTNAGAIYKHYLGLIYVIIGESTDFNTGAVSVIFKDSRNKVWNYPLAEFFSYKIINDVKIPTFQYIGELVEEKK